MFGWPTPPENRLKHLIRKSPLAAAFYANTLVLNKSQSLSLSLSSFFSFARGRFNFTKLTRSPVQKFATSWSECYRAVSRKLFPFVLVPLSFLFFECLDRRWEKKMAIDDESTGDKIASDWNVHVWFIGYPFRRRGANVILLNPNERSPQWILTPPVSRGEHRKLEFANILMRKLQVLNSHLRGACFKTTFLSAISPSHASLAFLARVADRLFRSLEIVSTSGVVNFLATSLHCMPLSGCYDFSYSFMKQTLIYYRVL